MHAETADDTGPTTPPELLGRIGPFVAHGRRFVIESPDLELLVTIDDRLCDLEVSGADGVAPDPEDDLDRESTTVFTIEQNGPAWLSHPWALWRDGEPCETTVTGSYIVPYVVWEVTRLVLESAVAPIVPIHAAAVERDGKATVLCGPSHAGKSTLSAWLTHRGWGFLTDEVGLLDVADPSTTVVRPFWRPVGVRRGGPVDAVIHVDGDAPEMLVPATRLGRLGTPSPLVALVCPQYTPGGDGVLAPLSPAEALTTVAAQLPSLGRDGAEVFHALADVVSSVPAFALPFDDLDVAEASLAALVDGLEPPGATA